MAPSNTDGRTVDAPTLPSNVVAFPVARQTAFVKYAAHKLAAELSARDILSHVDVPSEEHRASAVGLFGITVVAAVQTADEIGLPPWNAIPRTLRAALICAEVVTTMREQLGEHSADDTSDGMDDAMDIGAILSHLALGFAGSGACDV